MQIAKRTTVNQGISLNASWSTRPHTSTKTCQKLRNNQWSLRLLQDAHCTGDPEPSGVAVAGAPGTTIPTNRDAV